MSMYSLIKRLANASKIILPLILLSFLFASCASALGKNSGSPPEQNNSLLPEQTYSFKIEAAEGGTIPAGAADILNGNYKEGKEIRIQARSMPGYYFSNWTSSSGGTFADANDSTTTFTMPGNNTVVIAHFALSE